MKTATGGCLCGNVKYELEKDAVLNAIHCHCLDCQKSTGSGKATIVVIPEDSLSLQGALKYYSVVGTDGATIERGSARIVVRLLLVQQLARLIGKESSSLKLVAWMTLHG